MEGDDRANHQTDACPETGKIRHRHWKAARAAQRRMTARVRRWGGLACGRLVVYRCRHCAGWHVGNAWGE
jgi:hypothetical protein